MASPAIKEKCSSPLLLGSCAPFHCFSSDRQQERAQAAQQLWRYAHLHRRWAAGCTTSSCCSAEKQGQGGPSQGPEGTSNGLVHPTLRPTSPCHHCRGWGHFSAALSLTSKWRLVRASHGNVPACPSVCLHGRMLWRRLGEKGPEWSEARLWDWCPFGHLNFSNIILLICELSNID